jgi:type VI secretion system protein ImpE
MTTGARELLREGDLAGALQALQAQIRAEPAKPEHRVFLFQLLCVTGEWDRALTQLAVAAEMDPGTLGMVHVYRSAVQAEVLRREVFSGRKTPLIFGDPDEWIALLLESLKLTAIGEIAKGQELREQAFELAPATLGLLNGQPFEWLADADMRLGPMLEAIMNGRYYWIPFHRIAELQIEEPQDLRDLVWVPARFKWTNGGEAVALLPGRYPGSEASPEPLVRLARRTEWVDQGHGLYFGLGQRMLATDADEFPLMDVRTVVLSATPADQRDLGANG